MGIGKIRLPNAGASVTSLRCSQSWHPIVAGNFSCLPFFPSFIYHRLPSFIIIHADLWLSRTKYTMGLASPTKQTTNDMGHSSSARSHQLATSQLSFLNKLTIILQTVYVGKFDKLYDKAIDLLTFHTASDQGTLFDLCAIEKTRANLLAALLLCCNAWNNYCSFT